MSPSPRTAAALWLCAAVCSTAPSAHAQSAPSIQRAQVLPSGGQVEIEIEASARVVPQANVIAGPDRLIIDFVNATPGAQLRNQVVNRKQVKSMRVGLFSSNPPVTRVVFDLNGPQPYQVFPSGKTVIVKIGTTGTETATANPAAAPELVSITYPPADAPTSTPTPAPVALPPPKPPLVVSFRNGLLSINSDQATLSEVLFAVHQRTGAEIAIPAGAEQEKVVAHLGPAPAPEVLAHLLNGTKFNFMILSSASDPHDLDRVILSLRGEGGLSSPNPQLQPMAVEDERTMQPNAVPPPQPEPPPTAENPPTEGQAPPPPPNDNPN
jgi:hypothetical protein